jgi:COP9 signalosome complex subunit 2
MLMESAVDPFDAQEVKPYRDDPDVTAMRALVGAYQRNDITTFERLLSAHRARVMGDDFIRDYIEDLLKNIRTQVLLNLIKPYTTITIPHISTELNIPETDVEALVVALILDERVDARVDQLAGVVRIRRRARDADDADDADDARARGLARWADRLRRLHAAVSGRLVSNPRA